MPTNSSATASSNSTWHGTWPLERVLFAIAGTVVLAGSLLAALVSPWFLLLTGFVAVNQLLYASVGFCGASLILNRVVGLEASCQTASAAK